MTNLREERSKMHGSAGASKSQAGATTLRLRARIWDRHVRARAPNYLFQCGMATAFIIFVVPDSVAATPRKVIGGHATAVLPPKLVNLL